VDRGIGLRELAEKYHNGEGEFPPVFATVDGEITGMGSELRHSSLVEFYDMRSRLGRLMYQRTVYFLFQIAVNELIPGIRTTLRYPINDGLLVEFDRRIEITKVFAWNVEKKMREIIAAGRPFEKQVLSREEIVSMGRPSYLSDRLVDLMLTGDADQVYVYSYGSFREEFIDPLMESPAGVDIFELVPYDGNMIIRVPHFGSPGALRPYRDDKKLYRTFADVMEWRKITEVEYIDDLNRKIIAGEWRDLILISEAQHEKNIAAIADQIKKTGRRIILIAGPSASGKTTFAQRLCIQLRVNGMRPLYMGTDDYFVERSEMVPDETGKLNFEDLTAVDIDLFNQQMNDLLRGKTVDMPVFDFITGSKRYGVRITRAEEDQPIVIEGIHALNPELTSRISESEKFRVYISPLTVLNLDENNRIPVTDIRLVRRMARDLRSRNRTAAETLEQWNSVRAGEEKNIFPFSGEADVLFNSTVIYELAALRPLVEEGLEKVQPGDEKYLEAQRILRMLRCVKPLEDYSNISTNSIIREFTGGGIWVK
jgi:uridine kinase